MNMKVLRYLPSIFYLLTFSPLPTIAQIIPDKTLGTENSRTMADTVNGKAMQRIDGGAIRNSHLFHSFQEFNIGAGEKVYFTNPTNITNIFTRITGNNPSNISGTLGVLGNANLFLLNPKGIIFGPNAQLDLHGSFLASTADSVVFDHSFEFSSTNPQIPVLTINIPIGLRFRDTPGAIVNQSQVVGQQNLPTLPIPVPISHQIGLAVDSSQTLALVGGDIQLAGGNITASMGQILLGSVASPGLVSFVPTATGLNLNYDNISTFGNIQISGSQINTSGLGGGKIDIRGANVTLSGSQLYGLTWGNINGSGININAQTFQVNQGSQISTLTQGNGAGSAVNIHATDSVELSGIGFTSFQQTVSQFLILGTFNFFDPQNVLITGTAGAGAAGNIIIDTGKLLMNNGVVAGSPILGAGNGGNLSIHAQDFQMVSSFINNGTLEGSSGTGGNINFTGGRFIISDGGGISSITRTQAASGNINIQASELVELLPNPTGSSVQSLISTNSVGIDGNAGDITIYTKRLYLSGGSGITSANGAITGKQKFITTGGTGGNLTIRATESVELSGVSNVLASGGVSPTYFATGTFSSSRGGDISISTPVVTLRDGGIISAASLGSGLAGNIKIDANRVEIIGSGNNGQFISSIEASVGSFFGFTNPNATGNAGSLNLNVNQLILNNGSTLSTKALGSGGAGNIHVVSNAIALNHNSRIEGTTVSGIGANINLTAQNIQLRNGSKISTDAGTSDGGNIHIKSDILLGFPQENSDITANARTAQGGIVTINVPYVFGFTTLTRDQVKNQLGLNDEEFAALSVNPTFLLSSSDITAISQTSAPTLQGTVTFSTSGINPAQGLVELPKNVVDPTTLIAVNLCNSGTDNKFTITGRGGVPSSPNDVLGNTSPQFIWVEGTAGNMLNQESQNYSPPVAHTDEIIPARGWMMNHQGEVTLLAEETIGQKGQRLWQPLSVCIPH